MFRCAIKTGNAAFGENKEEEGAEIARILRWIAEDIENGEESGICIDINGNNVGSWGR